MWEEAVCFQALGPSEPDCRCLSTPQCVLTLQLPRQPSRALGPTVSQGCRGSLLALHLKHVQSLGPDRGSAGTQAKPGGPHLPRRSCLPQVTGGRLVLPPKAF